MKNKIIEILKKYPAGLKAREIAALIPRADRRTVNQILYDNPSEFEKLKDYVWTLKHTEPVLKATPSSQRTSPLLEHAFPNQSREIAFNRAISHIGLRHASIFEGAKSSILKLQQEDFDRFCENVTLLGTNATIPNTDIKHSADIDACIQIALLPSEQVKEIITRSDFINRVCPTSMTFSCWHRLVLLQSYEFRARMQYAREIRSTHILPALTCDRWVEILTMLNTPKKWAQFQINNAAINASFGYSDVIGTSWSIWKRVVLLSPEAFKKETDKLKAQKNDA